jgi:DNA-binding CsgD family transcriptional regulator/PAS domain-containing protein
MSHVRPVDLTAALLPALYDAAGNDALWRPALEAAADALGAMDLHYFAFDKRAGGLRFYETAGRLPRASSMRYFAEWAPMDVQAHAIHRAGVGRTIASQHLFDEAFIRHDPFLNEFLIPLGVRWGVGAKVLETAETLVILGLHRGEGDEAFTAEELARVEAFVAAMAGPATLHASFRTVRASLEASRSMVDTFATGLIVTDDSGRILFANAAAEALLSQGDGLTSRQGRVVARDPAAQSALAAGIAGAVTLAARLPGTDTGGLLLPRRAGRDPLRIGIWPLPPDSAAGPAAQDPRVLLTVTDPSDGVKPDIAAFAAMFRLTPAEADVAERLAEGMALSDMAEQRGVLMSTLRSQLAAVFAKTGTQRQAELVRLLSQVSLRRRRPERRQAK